MLAGWLSPEGQNSGGKRKEDKTWDENRRCFQKQATGEDVSGKTRHDAWGEGKKTQLENRNVNFTFSVKKTLTVKFL